MERLGEINGAIIYDREHNQFSRRDLPALIKPAVSPAVDIDEVGFSFFFSLSSLEIDATRVQFRSGVERIRVTDQWRVSN